MTGFMTGWCSNGDQSNHHLCHHVYDVKGTTYTCTCPCHKEPRVRKVARRPETNGAEEKHLVPRRPVQRRQVRRV